MRIALPLSLFAAILFPFVAFFSANPAPAAEIVPADPSCPTVAEVEAQLTARGEKFVELRFRDLIGRDVEKLGVILVSTIGEAAVIGFEFDGCMKGPISLGKLVAEHAT